MAGHWDTSLQIQLEFHEEVYSITPSFYCKCLKVYIYNVAI